MMKSPGIVAGVAAMLAAPAAFGWTDAEIVQSCTQLNYDYVYHRDRGDIEAYANLFTEDGEFEFLATMKGRQAIGESARKRWEESVSRHFIQPTRIEPTGRDTATGVIYLALYAAPRQAEAQAGPIPIPGVRVIASYLDRYRMTDEGCRFERRKVDVHFERKTE
ncbi:MAG: nuclear transport factor 2 family protein [Pseudomonadota bacterium]